MQVIASPSGATRLRRRDACLRNVLRRDSLSLTTYCSRMSSCTTSPKSVIRICASACSLGARMTNVPSCRRIPNSSTVGTSDGIVAELAGPDAHEPVDRCGPDLAVADLAGAGSVADDLDHLVDVAGLGEYLDHDLRNEVDLVLVAAE